MPISPPCHRLNFALALSIALLAIVMALIAPAGALAKTRKQACPARTAAHVKAKARRSDCATHRSKPARQRTRTRTRHAARRQGKGHGKAVPAEAVLTPALCEDNSAPVRASDGTFSCDDGSEPGCEDESSPVRSGSTLECVVSETAEPPCEESTEFCYTGTVSSNEPVCEDGSTPTALGAGPAACDDGSEPRCEDSSAPIPVGSNGLVCDDSVSDGKNS